MSNQEASEYMKNVRWTTGGYVLASTISIALTLAGVYYGLKGDIKDSRYEAKEQIRYVFTVLNSKVDSLQRINTDKFKDLADQISGIPAPVNTTIIKHAPKPHVQTIQGFTEKWINGKLYLFPVTR